MTSKANADHPADLALACYVLADGVFLNGQPIPEFWFQVDFPGERFSRIMVAEGFEAIAERCEAIAQGGLQPIVIVEDVDSPAFLALNEVAGGAVSVRYSIREGQRLQLLDTLATPDAYAFESWRAMAAGDVLEARVWPKDFDVLGAFGASWRDWCARLPSEENKLQLGDRRFGVNEFRFRVMNDDVYFSHATAPFAILKANIRLRKLYCVGGFEQVPNGITADALISFASGPGPGAVRLLPRTRLIVDESWVRERHREYGSGSDHRPLMVKNQRIEEGLTVSVERVEGGLRFVLLGLGAKFAGRRYLCGVSEIQETVDVELLADDFDPDRYEAEAFLKCDFMNDMTPFLEELP